MKDNSYLLLAALLLFSISIFTRQKSRQHNEINRFEKKLTGYVRQAEKKFEDFVADTAQLKTLISPKPDEKVTDRLSEEQQFFFIYRETAGFTQLLYWNTQVVLPVQSILFSSEMVGFAELPNGYYVWQKRKIRNLIMVSLLPIQWNYIVANNNLQNKFVIDKSADLLFEIDASKGKSIVSSSGGGALFFLKEKTAANFEDSDNFTVWLRILMMIPLLLFVHFATGFIYQKKGLLQASIFLLSALLVIRIISYFFAFPVNLRRFDLFDPAIYGADIVLRSLGDLLINTLLFFWVISFVRKHLKGRKLSLPGWLHSYKWWLLAVTTFIVLFVTYSGAGIIRSLVADSQISFDVLDFFSLNVYSVIGFLVLCCIAIGYYYFCRVLLYLLSIVFRDFLLPLCAFISAGGLLLLSFQIGNIEGGFELYALVWLLAFLLLIKNDLAGFFSHELIVSKMVFWLFFFSASISAVIITENSRKELRDRRHYAEVIAEKNAPITEVLINTMLTEFRADMLSSKFYLFEEKATNVKFKDSLVSNNFSGYTDKYTTGILTYDNAEAALYNENATTFDEINSILNTQAKPSSVEGLYSFDGGFDRFSYISKKTVNDFTGRLLGYIFIIIGPKDFTTQKISPELFGRGHANSIGNSSEYAYAIYDKGRLTESHNDYAFSTRYPETYFPGKQFLLVNKKKYNELWYNAGNDKFIVVVKENKVIIESITLFSYLFCSFLLLSAFSWLISFAVRSRLQPQKMRTYFQLSIKQQVHGTIIFFSALSFVVIGIATILFFINRYENNNKETLSRTISIMERELQRTLTNESVQAAVFEAGRTEGQNAPANIINNIAEVYGLDVNLYTTGGDLKASSLPLPYLKGILSTKMNPLAFYHLNVGREIQYLQKEKIGKLSFVSDYIPVTDKGGNDIAYLNIPYFISQTRLEQEISNFLVTIINLNAFIFLIAGIVALIITNKITNSFSFISAKMKEINLGKINEKIEWNRNDEIGALVNEYNRMLAKLDESAAALARTERENAWQEMAKQVAHEIKNPLTPMKLSMQFLQRSIETDAPNIKELAVRVSATLVEQIDHLSTIAGEFSRFANIENARPEVLNLNDALQSVRLLYDSDQRTQFDWELLPGDVMINADKTHINRILTNLILNGIQAVPIGLIPKIRVSEELSGSNVLIKISDNGSGIAEEIRGKIFTPNFTTKSSGTGLGLAMCKRMAEHAGGDIRYETSDSGTTFFVSLPLV